jgi:hypothetical protein
VGALVEQTNSIFMFFFLTLVVCNGDEIGILSSNRFQILSLCANYLYKIPKIQIQNQTDGSIMFFKNLNLKSVRNKTQKFLLKLRTKQHW